MCPIVPIFRCGLVRSNFSFAIDPSTPKETSSWLELRQVSGSWGEVFVSARHFSAHLHVEKDRSMHRHDTLFRIPSSSYPRTRRVSVALPSHHSLPASTESHLSDPSPSFAGRNRKPHTTE